MPNLAATLKDEIRRLARKEIKAHVQPARRAAAQHRSDIAKLKRLLQLQERKIAALVARAGSEATEVEAEGEDATSGARFSARSVRAQRSRLKLSAQEFGKLVGVSALSVYKWEHGKARPRKAQFASLIAVRGLSRREALKRLEEMSTKRTKRGRR